MLDLLDELRKLVAVFDQNEIEYALCGGMAMSVHGRARTTIDIDLLILSDSSRSRRVSKIDPEDGELLSLDLLLVTPTILAAWESRLKAEWEDGKLSVVSAIGLIALKQLRGSDQDLVDIKALTGEGSNETS